MEKERNVEYVHISACALMTGSVRADIILAVLKLAREVAACGTGLDKDRVPETRTVGNFK